MKAFDESSLQKIGEDGYGEYCSINVTLKNETKRLKIKYYEPSSHPNVCSSYQIGGMFMYGKKGFRRPEYITIVKSNDGSEFAYLPKKYCKRVSIKNLEFISWRNYDEDTPLHLWFT